MELRHAWLDVFQHIMYNDYLVNLRERSHGRSQVAFRNRLKINYLVLVKRPLKPFWTLETVLELFRCDDGVIRSVCIKQGDGPVQVHSLKYPCLQTSKVNLELITPPLSSATPGNDAYSGTSSVDETIVCLSFLQQDMNRIGCDHCDEWVGIDMPPLQRRKWHCPEWAPLKRRHSRPSLLPA